MKYKNRPPKKTTNQLDGLQSRQKSTCVQSPNPSLLLGCLLENVLTSILMNYHVSSENKLKMFAM